jgi:hypothetical protein
MTQDSAFDRVDIDKYLQLYVLQIVACAGNFCYKTLLFIVDRKQRNGRGPGRGG